MTDFPDYRDDPLERPQFGGIAPFGRTADEGGFESLQRRGIESGFPAGAADPAQARRAVRPPRFVPTAGGLAGDVQFAYHIGLTLTAGKQLRRAVPARFQSCEIPSGAKSGRHEGIVAGLLADVTILRKHH